MRGPSFTRTPSNTPGVVSRYTIVWLPVSITAGSGTANTRPWASISAGTPPASAIRANIGRLSGDTLIETVAVLPGAAYGRGS